MRSGWLSSAGKSSALKPGRVFAAADSFAARFDADHSYLSILQKRMEQADGVAAAADAGNQQIGKASLAFENLATCFHADDALKIAHHHRIGMGTEH